MKDVSWYFHFTIFQYFKYKLKEYRGKKLITKELNLNFLILVIFQPDVVDIQYFKIYILQDLIKNFIWSKCSWFLRNRFFFLQNKSNFYFLIPISLQPDGVNMWYFQLRLFDLIEFIKFEIYKVYDTGIIKSEFHRLNSFVPKLSQFL